MTIKSVLLAILKISYGDSFLKKCAIVQSSYIPWRGYFDLINSVDEFILFDDVQYTKRDWRSRNQIKTAQGLQWLTIPVQVKGKYTQLIKDVVISDNKWVDKHWNSIEFNYHGAVFFEEVATKVHSLYHEAKKIDRLSEINYLMIKNICAWLNIKTKLSWSMDYKVEASEKNQRLIELCKAAKASYYLSGPSAESYINRKQFEDCGIALGYINYQNYPIYKQCFSNFEPAVSIIDLLFNTGAKNALNFIIQNSELV